MKTKQILAGIICSLGFMLCVGCIQQKDIPGTIIAALVFGLPLLGILLILINRQRGERCQDKEKGVAN